MEIDLRFPKDKVLAKIWCEKMKRESCTPTGHSWLCSDHFNESCCYATSPWVSKKVSKSDSVPTMFNFPEPLLKKTQWRCLLRKRSIDEVNISIALILNAAASTKFQ